MLTHAPAIARLRPHYTEENRDLFRVLLNATSAAESNLAIQVLIPLVPEKALVTACNLREVLRALPASPFTMRVDELTLLRAAGLKKQTAALGKTLDDGLELAVTTAGNLVLDVIVKRNGVKYFWTPVPVLDDFVNPEVVDLVVESDTLLDSVYDLVKCMGVVINPRFYLSLDDFALEYAEDTLAELGDLF